MLSPLSCRDCWPCLSSIDEDWKLQGCGLIAETGWSMQCRYASLACALFSLLLLAHKVKACKLGRSAATTHYSRIRSGRTAGCEAGNTRTFLRLVTQQGYKVTSAICSSLAAHHAQSITLLLGEAQLFIKGSLQLHSIQWYDTPLASHTLTAPCTSCQRSHTCTTLHLAGTRCSSQHCMQAQVHGNPGATAIWPMSRAWECSSQSKITMCCQQQCRGRHRAAATGGCRLLRCTPRAGAPADRAEWSPSSVETARHGLGCPPKHRRQPGEPPGELGMH